MLGVDKLDQLLQLSAQDGEVVAEDFLLDVGGGCDQRLHHLPGTSQAKRSETNKTPSIPAEAHSDTV